MKGRKKERKTETNADLPRMMNKTAANSKMTKKLQNINSYPECLVFQKSINTLNKLKYISFH